jgi:hypothetical protein
MALKNFRKSSVVVNGETNSTSAVSRAAGYVNWIADNLRKNFQATNTITKSLAKTSIQLSYPLGGYSTKRYLTVIGEQSSPAATSNGILIPEDDYEIFLHKSQPVAQIVYSAVVVKKTNLGYSVSGYNTARPYFTIIPSVISNNSYSISVDGVGAVVYNDYESYTVDLAYNTEFTTIQQVVDFLISYQRYLTSTGVLFVDTSPTLKEMLNFTLSAKEFLTWHLQGWKENNLIVLSPIADTLKVNLSNGTTDRIQHNKLYSRVLDQNFNIVENKDIDVNRYDNFTSIFCKRVTTIGLVVLDVVEYEHQIIFNNITQFNDIIYQPELGNRQSRLKISGIKTDNWLGTLDVPGFIINIADVNNWSADQVYSVGDIVKYKVFYYVALENNTGLTFNSSVWQQIDYNQINQTLLPNLSTLATMSRDYYDANSVNLNESIDSHARGLIGFRSRSYFNELGIDSVSQTKFYQGFIRNKGTAPSLSVLKNVNFGKLTNTVDIYEDWAFRVGEYGGTDVNQFIEIALEEAVFSANPGIGEFVNTPNNSATQQITVSSLYKKPFNFTALDIAKDYLEYREDSIRSAGYVDSDDVNATIFDIQDLSSNNLLSEVYPGYVFWCALDYTRDWNVFRVSDTGLNFKEVSNMLDQLLMIEFKDIHQLVPGDIVAVKNFSPLIDGFYQVDSTPTIDSIIVVSNKNLQGFTSTTGTGVFYKMVPLRYSNIEDSVKFTPQNNWRENEKIWIDNYSDSKKWAVLEKRSPWNFEENKSLFSTETLLTGFGGSLATESTGTYLISGTSSKKVIVYKRNSNTGNYTVHQTLTNAYTGNVGFGVNVDYMDSILAVGDLGFASSGAVILYQKNSTTDQFEPGQFIAPVLGNTSKFGFSFVLSTNYLIVGAPGINTIYIYKRESQTAYSLPVPTPSSTISMQIVPTAANSIILITAAGTIISPRTYTVSGSTITFSVVPTTAYTIHQRSYYFREAQIINDKSVSGLTDFFGYSLDINATEDKIYVGAPYANLRNETTQKDTVNAGRVVAYHLYSGYFQFMQRIEPTIPEVNGEFGSSVKASNDGCSVFVGAPGVSFVDTYRSGQLYRFVNLGRTAGTVSTVPITGNLIAAGIIVINGVEVLVSGSIENVKSQIDAANIPYVSTSVANSILTISSSSLVEFDKLNILPGISVRTKLDDPFVELGLAVFTEQQVIPNPINRNLSRFGEELDLSNNNMQLFVSSPHATTILNTIFDDETCYFDSDATIFRDQEIDSGSVCVFEFIKPLVPTLTNSGSYIFGQQLESAAVSPGDLFGSSLAVANETVFVGAPGDDILHSIDNRGRIQLFNNPGIASLWSPIKTAAPLINVDRINQVYLYNKKTGIISAMLDIVDPIKGRILGIARQDIDFISSQDPAAYNRSSGLDLLGDARVNDNNYWAEKYVGRYWFDTSQIRFVDYEQQDVDYRKNNWNRLFDGSAVRVYQWIGSDVLPSFYSNFYSGEPKYLEDQSYVVDYIIDKNTGGSRARYYFWVRDYNLIPDNKGLSTTAIEELIENPKASTIPYIVFYSPTAFGLYNTDSYIDGENTVLHIDYDQQSNDSVIHSEYELAQENNNTSNPPSRILKKFIDSLAGIDAINNPVPDPALRVSERYGLDIRPRQTLLIDRTAALEVLVKQANAVLTHLFAAERIVGTGFFYKQGTQDARNYWRYTAWVAEGYDITTKPQYTVAKFADIQKRNYVVGTIIKVTNNGDRYAIVKTTADGFDLQAQERGTIELLPAIYQTATTQTAVRKVIESLFYDLLIEDYAVHANKLFFVLVKYALREQKYIDWAFKTSFLTINHDVTQFEQWPNYQPDNSTYLIDYISEAKPYHTKIREYRPRYNGTTTAGVAATDFDLPAFYDADLGVFRSPSGETPGDSSLWANQPQYQEWYNNYKLVLASVSISVPGTGYFTPPTITIAGGGGTGATARAVVSGGSIVGVIVVNPGANYTSTPAVTLARAGIDRQLNVQLVAAALADKIAGKPVDTVLNAAFDTVVGGFKLGDLTNSGIITKDDVDLVKSYITNTLTGPALTTVNTKLTAIQNYVIANNGTNNLNVDAVLSAKLSNSSTRTLFTHLLFDRIAYTATNTDVGFDLQLFDEDTFDSVNPEAANQNALDRAKLYYTSEAGSAGLDYAQLFSGIEFPGYNVQGIGYSDGSGFDAYAYESENPTVGYSGTGDQNNLADMILQGSYKDLLLGTRAEDIVFDGGKFIDPAHSHAPEEMVPGIVFDTLEIRVFHKFAGSSTPNITLRMFKNLIDQYSYYRMSSTNATTLSQPLLIGDTEISVTSAAVLDIPSPTAATPGIIFIKGERITYFERDTVNNKLRRIRRGTAGTGAPAVHASGTVVVGSGASQILVDAHTTVWYDPQIGLENSTTDIAKFLKDQPPVSVT